MQRYSLDEIRDLQDEVLEKAAVPTELRSALIAPVLLTEESKPGYMIMLAQNYQKLIDQLIVLEDCALGQ